MVDLDCSEFHVVGTIRPAFGTTLGLSAIHCHGDFLVSFLIGNRKDPGFFIGGPACHPRSLLGYQIKISTQQEVESDELVIPTVLAMIRNVGFFFQEGPNSMVELILGAYLEDGRYLPAGIWANHTYSPFGKQAAAKVSRLFNFFNPVDWGTMQSLITPSIGAH